MPQEAGSEQSSLVLGLFIRIHDVHIFKSGLDGNRGGGMLVQFAKITHQLTVSLNVQVILTTEEDDATRCHEAGQIILLSVCESRQVKTVDFRANLGVVVEDVGRRVEQVEELSMSLETSVLIRSLRQRFPMNIRKPRSKTLVLIVGDWLYWSAARDVGLCWSLLERMNGGLSEGELMDGLFKRRSHVEVSGSRSLKRGRDAQAGEDALDKTRWMVASKGARVIK